MQNKLRKTLIKLIKSKLLIILFIGLILRLASLNQSLWLDEAINILAARKHDLNELVYSYMVGDFHPPLYSIILWGWFRIFPSTEAISRIPSIIFALTSITLTFLIGKNIFSDSKHRDKLAFLSGLLVATSGLHIYYSQEARMYMLATATTSLAILATIKLINKQTLVTTIFYLVSLVLMLMSDYQPWLLLPMFFLIFPGLTSLSILFTLPWWTTLIHQLGRGISVAKNFPAWGNVVGSLNLKTALLVPIKFLVGRISIDNNLLFALVLIIPVLVLFASLIKSFITKRKSLLLIKAWLIVPFIIALIVSLKVPIFSYFRFLFVLPAGYLLFVDGTNRLHKPVKTIAISILLITNLVSSFIYLSFPKFQRENWKAAARYITSFNVQESMVLFPNLAQSAGLVYYSPEDLVIKDKDTIEPDSLSKHVFLIRYVQEIFDPQDSLKTLVEEAKYTKIQESGFNNILIWRYQKDL